MLENTLKTWFGFEGFREGQKEILSDVLAKHDTLAVMPTGRGKSLCYQLPALVQEGIVLVISPLVALMRDQVHALKQKGIHAGCLHAQQPLAEKKTVFRELQSNKQYLLYLSPERVQKPGFARWISAAPVSLFAIDEAHCLSQWGPDFRPDYYRLKLLRELRPEIPILGLTATATPEVLLDIKKQLSLHSVKKHVYGFYRPNLYYQIESCVNEDEKKDLLIEAIRCTSHGKIIIYAGTRKKSEELCEELQTLFSDVSYYHAGLQGEQRHEIQKQFNENRIRILIATNAFGMGVDQADIRLVVHYQIPANIESYYQEIGRAGRDGKHATCLLLYTKKDKGLQSYFIIQSNADEMTVKRRWQALDTLIQYVEGGECRHAGILTYFRDHQRITNCGHCDVCSPDSKRRIQKPQTKVEPIKKVKQKSKKKAAIKYERPLNTNEQIRLEVIKEWRYEYAKSRDIPAFIVFSNKTLEDLVRKDPNGLDGLAKVYGLGTQKIEAFGSELLNKLAECRQ